MVEKFDVPSRLAEGRPAVETVQHYVWACHLLGYQHPDLTLHAAQARDWYDSEAGLDLAALQADCVAFDAAVGSTQDALAVQDRQLSALAAAWQGEGAAASTDFLSRHGDASRAAAAAIRTAAEALSALRENLWEAVDAKVQTVLSIDSGTLGAHADWLTAAKTVTTGAGDRAAAAELVDQAVKPFVDNSIRTDWITAMHTAMASVADAYQRAAVEIGAEYRPMFEVPGSLGPAWSPLTARVCEEEARCPEPPAAPMAAGMPAGAAAPAATAPAAWSAPPSSPPPPPWSAPAPPVESAIPPVPAAAPPMPSLGGMPPLGGMGSGMPDMGSGLSGLGQQLAETLGGLLGGDVGGLADPPDLEPPDLEPPDLDPPDLEDPLEDPADLDEDDDDDDPEDVGEPVDDVPVEESVGAGEVEPEPDPCVAPGPPADEPVETVAAPVPTAPPPAEPLPPTDPPPADPVLAEQTPCAIAADELPQVGDPPE